MDKKEGNKLFEELSDFKKIIEEMTVGLDYVRDERTKETTIDHINKLIDVTESFEQLLRHNFRIDSLNTLILSLIREKMRGDQVVIVSKKHMEGWIGEIIGDLQQGYEQKLSETVSVISLAYDIRALDQFKIDNNQARYNKNVAGLDLKITKGLMETVGKLKKEYVWHSKG